MTPEQDNDNPEEGPKQGKSARRTVNNVLLVDILLRTGLRLGRRQVEKGLLRRNFSRRQARQIINGRSLPKSLISIAASRVASRSLPGAVLVGGGILAKLMIDARRSARTTDGDGAKMPAELKDEA